MREGTNFEEHRVDARIEDARFLLDAGETIEAVAKRLNVSLIALKKNLERR